MRSRKNKHNKYFYVWMALFLVSVLVVSAFIFIHRSNPKISPTPVATIKQLPTQPAANNGEKKLNSNTGPNDGTAKDNQGASSTPVTTNPNQWLVSASRVIVVKQPVTDSTIQNGVELIGTAKVSKIQYRLIDDQVGVISKGFINVVNGNFSANLSFTPHGNTGRLDVFSANDKGVESNEVQINVRF